MNRITKKSAKSPKTGLEIFLLWAIFALVLFGFGLFIYSDPVLSKKLSEIVSHFRSPTPTASPDFEPTIASNTNKVPVFSPRPHPVATTISPSADASPNPTTSSTRVSGPLAQVNIAGKKYDLMPNPIGSYPRYTVEPKATIPITPQLSPQEPVDLQVLDGGKLNHEVSTLSAAANNQGQLQFDFSVLKNPGSYRVLVERAGTRSLLDFWVGPPLPQRVSSSSP